MSVYTVQLRHIVVSLTGNMPPDTKLRDRIETARSQIFDFDYPIWNENARKNLETKIINNYLMEEIGLETYELWQHYLEVKMNEIMPYYVDKYNSIYPYIGKLYVNKDYHSHNSSESNLGRNDDYTQNSTGNVKNIEDLAKGDVYNEEETGTINLNKDKTAETNVHGNKDITGSSKDDETYGLTGSENGGYTNTETKDIDTTQKTEETNNSTRTDNLKEVKTNDLTHSIVNDHAVTQYGKNTSEDSNNTSNSNNSSNQLAIHSDLPQSALKVTSGGTAAGNNLYPISNERFDYDYATYSDQTQARGSTSDTGEEHKDTVNSGQDSTTRNATETDTGTVTTDNTGTQKNEGAKDVTLTGTDDEHNTLQNVNNKSTKEDYTKGNIGSTSNNEVTTNTENISGNEKSKSDSKNDINSQRNINQNLTSNKDTVNDLKSQRGINQNVNESEDYTVLGLDGKSYSELIGKYQEFITNIEADIIHDLSSLFMTIY